MPRCHLHQDLDWNASEAERLQADGYSVGHPLVKRRLGRENAILELMKRAGHGSGYECPNETAEERAAREADPRTT